jgi:hypothetical protein
MERITSKRCKFIIDEFKLKNDTKMIGSWGISSYGDVGKWEERGYDEVRLRKLGLKCSGGGQWGSFNAMKLETYYVFNRDETFYMELSKEEIDDIDKLYNVYLRKYKLDRLNEISEQV